MQVNAVNGKTGKLPAMIAIRTKDLAPLLAKWRIANPKSPWSCLLDDALRGQSPLVKLAGKRHSHMVGKAAA